MLIWLSQHMVIASLIGLVLTYIVFCLGYFVFHRFFIIFPSRPIDRLPTDFNMAYKEYFIRSYDNTKLQLWLIPGALTHAKARPAAYTLWFMPGNDGTLSKFLPGMKVLHEMGFDICMASYRGFGKSDKKHPFEKKLRHDALSVWSFLTKSRAIPADKIILYAQSIGCGLAAWSAAQVHPAGLILEGAFMSVPDVAQRAVPWLPVKLLTTERFSTKDYIVHVTCPVLILHSQDDQPIPIAHAKRLYALTRAPKQFSTITGVHAKGLEEATEAMTAAIIQFVATLLSATR